MLVVASVFVSKSIRRSSSDVHAKSGKVLQLALHPYRAFFRPGLLLLLLLSPQSSLAYYIGPEVGKAPGETRQVKTRAFGFGDPNATSLAEAAYVPYVYAVGDNVITFLRSIIPALQPKVDFFAEQIQDSIDVLNEKLMQKLENSNNGIIKLENFLSGLMRAVVLGKGPEEEERRRLAIAFIKAGMLTSTPAATTTSTTISATRKPSMSTTTTTETSTAASSSTIQQSSSTASSIPTSTGVAAAAATKTQGVSPFSTDTIITTTSSNPPPAPSRKARDNIFNKMKVREIVKNLL